MEIASRLRSRAQCHDDEGTLWNEPRRIEVRTLGELATKTGVLSVRDFAYDAHGLAAFERRVPPGRYPVDVAVVASRVAAMRVRFSDTPVVSWHPATFAGGSHVVGVDAANVALFDVGSFVTHEARTRGASTRRTSSRPRARSCD